LKWIQPSLASVLILSPRLEALARQSLAVLS
jgi:hypothetical protein